MKTFSSSSPLASLPATGLPSVLSLLVVLAAGSLLSSLAQTPTVQTEPETAPVPEISQREAVRKQEAVFRIEQQLDQAEALEQGGDLVRAKGLYLSALNTLPQASSTTASRAKATEGVIRINLVLLAQAQAQGEVATFEKLLAESLRFAPEDDELLALDAKFKKFKADPRDTTFYGNPAVNPDFEKQVGTVQRLFEESEQFRLTGQFDEAESRLKKVLALDPYNQQAQKRLQRIIKEKRAYAEVARRQARAERLREVEQGWSQPVKRSEVEAATVVATGPITRSTVFDTSRKLRTIIIPQVDFNQNSLQDVVNFLNARVRDLDPDKKGINFIPRPEAIATAKPVTISLRKTPLEEVLRYVTALADVKYKVDPAGILIVPLAESTETLVRRSFTIPPSFFPVTAPTDKEAGGAAPRVRRVAAAPAAAAGGARQQSNVTDVLKERGVEFTAPGATAVYLPSQGVLQVVNTQSQIDLIEELVNAGSTQTLIVEIEASLIEINQSDINDLTINSSFNFFSTPLNTSPQAATGLRGSSGLTQNSLDARLAGANSAIVPNRLEITGLLDFRNYTAVITALSRKTSTDLLSSPQIRVRSGEQATVNISRTFFFPETFRPPELGEIRLSGGGGGGSITIGGPAAISAFPESFGKQDLGVILNVQPTVGADNQTIDISLVPEVTEFEGFINYGSPIQLLGFTLSQNQIPQPVFNVRRVTTKVLLKDGFTMVLSGLMREEVDSINDKVPFLGDIPLLGRLFQSKAERRTKRNMLMFVTGRILRPDGELLNASSGTGAVPVAANR